MVLLTNPKDLSIPTLPQSIAPDSIGRLHPPQHPRPTLNPRERALRPGRFAPILPLPPGRFSSLPALPVPFDRRRLPSRVLF